MAELRDIEQVFLCILRGDNKNEINKKIAYFNGSDWQALYGLMVKSGLFPTCYKRLSCLELESVPAELLSRLRIAYFLNLKRNILLERENLRVIVYLKERNIAVIPLKGPVLARLLYDDLALRHASCDLDLLVRPEMVKEAQQRLNEIGFWFDARGGRPDFFHKYRKQVMLHKCVEGLPATLLDLHWGFRDRFVNTHIEDFWRGAREIDIDGNKISVPSYEDLLIYLTLTAISDFDFIQPRYLYDITQAIGRHNHDIDWDGVVCRAKTLGLRTALFFALSLSHKLFLARTPKKALEDLRPSFIKENAIKLWINSRNILMFRERVAETYAWRHFASSFVLSRNIFAGIKVTCNKIFLPLGEVMEYNKPAGSGVYIKRLLKPILRKSKEGQTSAGLNRIKKESQYNYAHH